MAGFALALLMVGLLVPVGGPAAMRPDGVGVISGLPPALPGPAGEMVYLAYTVACHALDSVLLIPPWPCPQ